MAIGFTHEETPVGLRVAQAVGLTASAYLFGQNASLSYIAIPALMQASAPVAAKQWEKAYDIGKSTAPPLAIISALATGYVAYHQDPSSIAFKLNIAATLLFPCIVPFTLIVMAPTNNKLHEKRRALAATSAEDKTAEVGVAQEETVHALLDKWATLNLARALIMGVGSALATWAAVSKLEIVGFGGVRLRSGANRLG